MEGRIVALEKLASKHGRVIFEMQDNFQEIKYLLCHFKRREESSDGPHVSQGLSPIKG